jgi:hypothetical protein
MMCTGPWWTALWFWVSLYMVGQAGFMVVFAGELTNSEGIEHKFEVEQVDDQTYPEYEHVPVMNC